MFVKLGSFFQFVGFLISVETLDVDVVFERNPNLWEDKNVVLYTYKGFFDPAVALAKKDMEDNLEWPKIKPNINFQKVDVTPGLLKRKVSSGVNLFKVLDVNKTGNLHGIINADQVTDGYIASEVLKKLYLHSFYDTEEKGGTFTYTIDIGPSPSYIASATIKLLDWLDTEKSSSADVKIECFYESSFGSEKVAASLKTLTKKEHARWSIYMNEFSSSMLSGASDDEQILFKSRISGKRFFDETVASAKEKTRVIIVIGSIGLIRQVTLALYNAVAEEPSIKFEEFMIIAIPSTLWPKPAYLASDMIPLRDHIYKNSDDEKTKIAFQNIFTITENFDMDKYNKICNETKHHFYDDDPHLADNYQAENWTINRPVPLWSGYVYDATLLLLKAIENGGNPANYYSYLVRDNAWTKEDFGGITPFSGEIDIDSDGKRVTKLIISHFDENHAWQEVAKYDGKSGFKSSIPLSQISWPSGSEPPKLIPKCGYRGCAAMTKETKRLIMIVIIVIVIFITLIVVAIYCFMRHQREKELLDMGWKIEYAELKSSDETVGEELNFDVESFASDENEAHGPQVGAIVKSLSLESLDLPDGRKQSYMNAPVFVKPLLAQFFMHMDRDLMKELKTLKDLRDEFIVSVLGLTRELDHYWLVLEDCTKGSLQDTLSDASIELDSNFKVSMIDDISKGMQFLHYKTNLGSHGNLKTSNVLISNNFTMKIADFGRSIFLSDMKKTHHHTEIEHNRRLLWRAPELLRKKRVDVNGTKQGDVYSFAIIAHEIITRQGPFNLNSLDNKETATTVVLKLKNKFDNVPYRPEFPGTIRHKPLRVISDYCRKQWWSEVPETRTNFRKICDVIKKYKPGKATGTFLDTAVKRLEKFSGALEKKAAEKEVQAKVEQKKFNELIEFFVPKVIVKSGIESFVPESLSNTTVAVLELSGTSGVLGTSRADEVKEMDTKFRNILDSMSTKGGFFFGQSASNHRVWVASRNSGTQHSHIHAIVKAVQHIMQKMETELTDNKLSNLVSVRAGMDTGTIHTGLVGYGVTASPKFDFIGVIDVADRLCSVAQGFEILVSPASHKDIQQITEKDIVLDFGTKQQVEQGGAILEAFLLKH